MRKRCLEEYRTLIDYVWDEVDVVVDRDQKRLLIWILFLIRVFDRLPEDSLCEEQGDLFKGYFPFLFQPFVLLRAPIELHKTYGVCLKGTLSISFKRTFKLR